MPSSLHFSASELACECCQQNLCRQEVYDMLEEFRALVGKPVIVTSGYRCLSHNTTVGGAPRSQHTLGTAADIRVEGMTAAELEAIARKCNLVCGIGRNDHEQFLHIDCRSGGVAAWCYSENGAQCAYYPAKEDAV